MAGIEQPRFVKFTPDFYTIFNLASANRCLLEYDEDYGLHFECPASLLLQQSMEMIEVNNIIVVFVIYSKNNCC